MCKIDALATAGRPNRGGAGLRGTDMSTSSRSARRGVLMGGAAALALAAGIGAASCAPSGQGGDGRVDSPAALQAALASARPGETIRLAPGVYPAVAIHDLKADGVTITSADPAHPAVINDLALQHASGLAFTNLEFAFPEAANDKDAEGSFGARVNNSSDIRFDHDNFHGALGKDPVLDIKGLHIVQSQHVVISNNEFQFLRVGIHTKIDDHIAITGNSFHDIRVDGIDNSASSDEDVSGNNFTTFHRVGEPPTGGDHGDAIQFWTLQDIASENITVTDNVIVQGTGRNFQGIFVQALPQHGQPFRHVTIKGNIIIGGSRNGILVAGAQDVTLADNTIVALAGETIMPIVRIEDTDGITLTGNAATKYAVKNTTHMSETGDKVSGTVPDRGLPLLKSWLSAHPHTVTVGPTSPEALTGRPSAALPSSSKPA